jgi:hypothetical protein
MIKTKSKVIKLNGEKKKNRINSRQHPHKQINNDNVDLKDDGPIIALLLLPNNLIPFEAIS